MKKIKSIARFVTPVMLLMLLVLPMLVFAQVTTGTNVPEGSGLTLSKIEDIIKTVANFLILIGVVIAIIFIIWGGLKYMAARGDDTKVKEARGAIMNGVIGAAVVLGVGVILNTTAAVVTRTFFGAGQ
ncbi:MAG: TrbC/VirB2 family protein [Candidatus Paceibacterota bacterium]